MMKQTEYTCKIVRGKENLQKIMDRLTKKKCYYSPMFGIIFWVFHKVKLLHNLQKFHRSLFYIFLKKGET